MENAFKLDIELYEFARQLHTEQLSWHAQHRGQDVPSMLAEVHSDAFRSRCEETIETVVTKSSYRSPVDGYLPVRMVFISS